MTIVAFRSAFMFLALLLFLLVRDKQGFLAVFKVAGLKGLFSGLIGGSIVVLMLIVFTAVESQKNNRTDK
jgi:succinate-acetate transporter protein